MRFVVLLEQSKTSEPLAMRKEIRCRAFTSPKLEARMFAHFPYQTLTWVAEVLTSRGRSDFRIRIHRGPYCLGASLAKWA